MTAEQRKTAVEQAIANQRLEGGEVSPETRKVMDDYVAGKMRNNFDDDEVIISAVLLRDFLYSL